MNRVFIAHAKADAETAGEMYKILKDAGMNPWMDNDVLPGQYIRQEVRQAIDQSHFFLALLSQKALSEKGAIHEQLRLAIRKGETNPENKIFVIPVRLDRCKVDNEFLQDRKPVDLFQSPEQGLEKLMRALTSERGAEENRNSPSPLMQISPESLQKIIERFKKDSHPPPSWFFMGICIAFGVFMWQFYGPIHFHDKEKDDHLKSATLFLNQGMYREALRDYWQTLKICENCPKAQVGRRKAEIFREMAETEFNPGAMATRLNNIPGVRKNDPHVLMLKGNLKARMNEPEAAEALYLKAVETEPALAEAWFGLSALYHKQGKKGNALEMIQKAVSIAESNFKYKDMLAWMYFETGQYDLAIQTYEKLLSDADFLLAYLEIAKVFLMNENPDSALEYLETLAEKIENDKIANLPANTGPWYFPTDGDPVVLDSLVAKQYYAWLSLAATRYLFDPASDAETLAQKAGALEIDSSYADQIRTLVDWDISEIQKKYGNDADLMKRAGEFRRDRK